MTTDVMEQFGEFIQLKNIFVNRRCYFAASLVTISTVPLSAWLHKQMFLQKNLEEV